MQSMNEVIKKIYAGKLWITNYDTSTASCITKQPADCCSYIASYSSRASLWSIMQFHYKQSNNVVYTDFIWAHYYLSVSLPFWPCLLENVAQPWFSAGSICASSSSFLLCGYQGFDETTANWWKCNKTFITDIIQKLMPTNNTFSYMLHKKIISSVRKVTWHTLLQYITYCNKQHSNKRQTRRWQSQRF